MNTRRYHRIPEHGRILHRLGLAADPPGDVLV
jgi:hypothetical protein